MSEITKTDCGCGCGGSHEKQPESQGISIMPSMESCGTSCGTESLSPPDPKEGYQKPGYDLYPFVEDFIETKTGLIPRVKTIMDKKDKISTILVRSGINRNDSVVTPGLYCVGDPDASSEVLVTANFKLTFDHVRRELKHINAWILVLDTKGVNVWCAAGKGTFATNELVKRITLCSLDKIVDHKRVIVPQLGATGVAARQVKKESGFRVVYGPVRATDIPTFLKNDKKVDKKMRRITFNFMERLILTPVELSVVIKPALITALVVLILSGFGPGIFSFSNAS